MSPPSPAPPLFRHAVRVFRQDSGAGSLAFDVDGLKSLEHARSLRRPDEPIAVTVLLRESGRASKTIAQRARRGAELPVDGDIRTGGVVAGTLRPCRIPPLLTTLTP
jgi:hypothetical protein